MLCWYDIRPLNLMCGEFTGGKDLIGCDVDTYDYYIYLAHGVY